MCWSFSVDEKQMVYKLVWELYKTTDKKRYGHYDVVYGLNFTLV